MSEPPFFLPPHQNTLSAALLLTRVSVLAHIEMENNGKFDNTSDLVGKDVVTENASNETSSLVSSNTYESSDGDNEGDEPEVKVDFRFRKDPDEKNLFVFREGVSQPPSTATTRLGRIISFGSSDCLSSSTPGAAAPVVVSPESTTKSIVNLVVSSSPLTSAPQLFLPIPVIGSSTTPCCAPPPTNQVVRHLSFIAGRAPTVALHKNDTPPPSTPTKTTILRHVDHASTKDSRANSLADVKSNVSMENDRSSFDENEMTKHSITKKRALPASNFVGIQTATSVPIRAVLRRKFAWKDYPELEKFLVVNRDTYLGHSAKYNYTSAQKEYNNRLTRDLLKVAAEAGYVFDRFSFVMIRDRIRCYYKSYIQAVKKGRRMHAMKVNHGDCGGVGTKRLVTVTPTADQLTR